MMTTAVVVAAILSGLTVYWRLAPRKQAAHTTTARAGTPATRTTAPTKTDEKPALLRICTPTGCACYAAQLLAGRPIDANRAPMLPLMSCKRMDCTCRYEAYPDKRRWQRRNADDRRDGFRLEDGRRYRPDRRRPNTVWDEAH